MGAHGSPLIPPGGGPEFRWLEGHGRQAPAGSLQGSNPHRLPQAAQTLQCMLQAALGQAAVASPETTCSAPPPRPHPSLHWVLLRGSLSQRLSGGSPFRAQSRPQPRSLMRSALAKAASGPGLGGERPVTADSRWVWFSLRPQRAAGRALEHPYRHTVPPVRVPEALAISPLKMHCASNRISTSLTPRKECIRDLL